MPFPSSFLLDAFLHPSYGLQGKPSTIAQDTLSSTTARNREGSMRHQTDGSCCCTIFLILFQPRAGRVLTLDDKQRDSSIHFPCFMSPFLWRDARQRNRLKCQSCCCRLTCFLISNFIQQIKGNHDQSARWHPIGYIARLLAIIKSLPLLQRVEN